MTLAIACRGLVKRFGTKVAVGGVDLDVARGQCLGLLGPNGAGKTTTVELLEGLHQPDEGSIELLGMRWGEGRDRELRQRLGVQLQETTLADKLEVWEAELLPLMDGTRTVAELVVERMGAGGGLDAEPVTDLDLEAPQGGAVGVLPLPEARRAAMDRFEREYVSELLRRHEGRVIEAAREAGVSRQMFQRLMARHGISRQEFRA